jgi:N-dimethylarginine dimethylaminohydrolase
MTDSTFSLAASGVAYTPEEAHNIRIKNMWEEHLKDKYSIVWNEDNKDQIKSIVEFLEQKLEVTLPDKQEDFLDAELFEL